VTGSGGSGDGKTAASESGAGKTGAPERGPGSAWPGEGERAPQNVALVIETSGSTGVPKRVALSVDALTLRGLTGALLLTGGYAIVEAKSKYEALALAQRFIDVHVDAGIKDLDVEIRPLYEQGQCGNAELQSSEMSCAS